LIKLSIIYKMKAMGIAGAIPKQEGKQGGKSL
jgi:hypothetical protein